MLWLLPGTVDLARSASTARDFLRFPLAGIFSPYLRFGLAIATLSPLFFEGLRRYGRRSRWLLLVPYVDCIFLSGNRTSWMMLSVALFGYGLSLYRAYGGIRWYKMLAAAVGGRRDEPAERTHVVLRELLVDGHLVADPPRRGVPGRGVQCAGRSGHPASR